MASLEELQRYELIKAIPGSAEEVQAELCRHSEIFKETKGSGSYDRQRAEAIALANINMLLDGEINNDALIEAQHSLIGSSAVANSQQL